MTVAHRTEERFGSQPHPATTTTERAAEPSPSGWKGTAKRVVVRTREDNLTLIAGGVAFYSLLSVIPALAAVVAIYGLVADPTDISRQVASVGAIPPEARDLLTGQLQDLTSQPGVPHMQVSWVCLGERRRVCSGAGGVLAFA